MEIIDAIKECETMKELDDLREEIHLAASFNEIDFKQVKKVFLAKKAQLQK
ncbi:hypothetical protein DHX103_14340 [Planococcus sp. X10-3]|uniref:hypothetical protein n=1 Tax=Planococcus sp. X10-3 TaxID=3061240 RepID=UPI003BB026CF